MTEPAHLSRSDASLAKRVAEGDVAAFASLYDRYVREVYAMAAHVLGSADAEEVVQDIFVRLWERAGQFEPLRGSFGAWFMALARHRIVDELRRRRTRELPFAEIEELIASKPDAVEVEEEARRNERQDRVLRALRALPPEQRRVLVLSYFGGLSQTAIAQALDWPLGTVKKRVRLALEKLRVSLADEQDVVVPEKQRISRQ